MKPKQSIEAVSEATPKPHTLNDIPPAGMFLVLNYWAGKNGWTKPNPYLRTTPYPLEFTLAFDHALPNIVTVIERIASENVAGYAARASTLATDKSRVEGRIEFLKEHRASIEEAIKIREELKKKSPISKEQLATLERDTEGAELDLQATNDEIDAATVKLIAIEAEIEDCEKRLETPVRSWTIDISKL